MPEPKTRTEKPSEKFKSAMRQILSVPKSELVKREAAYKKARRVTNGHK